MVNFKNVSRWRTMFSMALVKCAVIAASLDAHAAWQMTFSDEFNGGSLDTSKWNTQYHWSPTVINGELQYYNPDPAGNFEFSNGSLRIRADRRSMGGQAYTSGVITTLGEFSQTYGRFEMRAKLPKGQGLWPAFWLMPDSKTWPPEIDIMENIGSAPNEVALTYHYGTNANHLVSQTFYKGPEYSADYHTFAVEWSRGLLIWYVDGVERHRFQNTAVPNESFYIILNLAVGGGWPGSPNGGTVFPAYYDIDYVRAYKWVDTPTPTPTPVATPKPTPVPTPVPPPPATSGNLLKNPGFEGYTGWTNYGRSNISSSNMKSGSGAAYAESLSGFEQVVMNLQPNTQYRLTGFGKGLSTSDSVFIGVKDFGGNEIYKILYTTTYQQASIDFKTGPSSSSAKVYFYVHSGRGYGDDYNLVKISTEPVNLVKNASFESGTSPWLLYGSAAIVSSNAQAETKSCYSKAGSGCEQIIQGLKPNTNYELSGYLRAGSSSSVLLGVKDHGSAQIHSVVTSTLYTKVTVKFKTGASSTSAKIFVYVGSGQGNGDNLSLVQVP